MFVTTGQSQKTRCISQVSDSHWASIHTMRGGYFAKLTSFQFSRRSIFCTVGPWRAGGLATEKSGSGLRGGSIVANKAVDYEERFVCALFPGEFSDLRLAIPSTPAGETILEELRQRINEALDDLTYRERGILEMRFGLRDGYQYTLNQAGHVFNLTRERIRQLQNRAMTKLREEAADLRTFVHNLITQGRR